MTVRRARVHRLPLDASRYPIRSPRTGAELRILEVPGGADDSLKVKRVFRTGGRRAPEHVHLDFSERFEIVSGIADARVGQSELRLGRGATFYAGAGVRHVNPTSPTGSELAYIQTFTPATEGVRSYIRTLAEVLHDGRDDDGDLPWSLVLAIGDVTRERTYTPRLPYWFQRRALLPLGSYVAGTRGFDVQLARGPRRPARSAKRRREVRRAS